ncbi:hypothetical protein [Micromonospora rifamycinica]|uniref:Transmembrane protein n=1 Tax=Micromonospora rifamycinica TaxID=291594 RepID=A0A1C5HVW9_9ACTN|nr:hypothetical protein [Micromonospora rifamycinica]SCG50043.1 hypothetical protein GA0070623_1771 [Micromonospora rifamycinica]
MLLWSGTYPDSTIGFMQHVVSAATVFFLLWLTRTIALGRGGPGTVAAPGFPRRTGRPA